MFCSPFLSSIIRANRLFLTFFLLFGNGVYSQENNTIITATPFLNLVIDARTSGMGNLGVATSPDVFAQQLNPSKYIFSEEQKGISISYSPFNPGVTKDIYLGGITFFKKSSERSVWGVVLGILVLEKSF